MISEQLNNFFDQSISKLLKITGIDVIYLLDNNYQIFKEHKINNTEIYLQQILNIVNSETLINKTGDTVYKSPFHTYTLLNEKGLIIISKLTGSENFHLIIIAGEKDPVDLINLLKICKENRQNYEDFSKANV